MYVCNFKLNKNENLNVFGQICNQISNYMEKFGEINNILNALIFMNNILLIVVAVV